MSIPHPRWVLSGCWVAIVAVAFFAIDASSSRSWMLLLTIAFVPPVVLVRLWPEDQRQTVADVMRGRGGQS